MLTISERVIRYDALSWLWGLLAACLIGLGLFLDHVLGISSSLGVHYMSADAIPWFVASFILSAIPALMGNWLRLPFMPYLLRQAEAATIRTARAFWLAGGTLLLFIASVLFCLVVFILGASFVSWTSVTKILEQDVLLLIFRLFFLLSAPWLLTAPIAACWVCRDWLSVIPNLGAAGSKQGIDSH